MNLTLPEALILGQECVMTAQTHPSLSIIIAPSLPFLISIRESIPWMPPNFALSSQVVSNNAPGAYTGDIAAKQLDGLVAYCLVGHSERRRYHHESGSVVSEQIKQLLSFSITPIVCFGEMRQSTQKIFSPQVTTDLHRDLDGLTEQHISQCLFAYEPLWAIGTGNPATPDYVSKAIKEVKTWAKQTLKSDFTVLYGGSVNEENAGELAQVQNLDGLLVGGASLHQKSFKKICSLYDTSI